MMHLIHDDASARAERLELRPELLAHECVRCAFKFERPQWTLMCDRCEQEHASRSR